jgi:hypothetical protein
MPACVTALVTVTNQQEVLTYAKQVDATVAEYGGRFIVKGRAGCGGARRRPTAAYRHDLGVPETRASPGVVWFARVSGHHPPSP